MAAKSNATLAWAVGLGTLAVAGVVVVLYEQSQASSSTAAAPTPETDPCGSANKLAAAAAANPSGAIATFQASYAIWAAACVAQGGTPTPFPTNAT